MKIGIPAINKFYRTSAINGIIGFIKILSLIKFSLVTAPPMGLWAPSLVGHLL
jgi:hypothetical protein